MRSSLKFYLAGAILLLGTVMSITLSSVALNYFIGGMDSVQSRNMLEVAITAEQQHLNNVHLLNFHVTDRWQQVPQPVRAIISKPPQQPLKLAKVIDLSPWTLRPSSGAFVLAVDGDDGVRRYVSTEIIQEQFADPRHQQLLIFRANPFAIIVLFGLGAVLLCGLVVWRITRQITKPATELRQWASNLTPKTSEQPIPDFQFKELNQLASITHTSFTAVQQSVKREHEFLRHASHELRTPITIITANSAMLAKLTNDENSRQAKAQQRIERAVKTMSDLVETLLWMSREQQRQAPEQVAVGALIHELASELNYLSQQQKTQLDVNTDDSLLMLAKTPLRIVISNLIRNAIQHGTQRQVTIKQQSNTLTITNSVSEEDKSNDVGFGLGLKLSHKLAQQYGWALTEQTDVEEYRVTLQLK